MHIIIDNNKYDITEFINEHPGGADVFKEGADMTKEFEEVGHSQRAKDMLEKYLVKKDVPGMPNEEVVEEPSKHEDDDEISILEFLLRRFRRTKISRLVTKEDKANIHKTLGVSSLLSYAWYYYSNMKYGSEYGVPNNRTLLDVALSMFPPALLSLSSLQFKLSNNFPTNGHGVLNNEFRNVNVLFGLRAFIISFIGLVCRSAPNIYTILVWVILMLNMWLREKVTEASHSPGEKKTESFAIRSGIKYWEGCPIWFSDNIRTIYSAAQLGFYVWVLLTPSICPGITTLFVLHLAAFAGTLVKKDIIGLFGWHSIYLFSYLIAFIGFMREEPPPLGGRCVMIILTILAWILRVKGGVTRYSLWTIFTVALLLWRNSNIKTTFVGVAVVVVLLHLSDCLQDPPRNATDFRDIVLSNKEKVSGIHEINISIKDDLKFKPGQYMNLFSGKESRPYTPIEFRKKSVTFLIKAYKEGVSQKICEGWKKNTEGLLSGPFGSNYYDPMTDQIVIGGKNLDAKKIIMFCCGTGITPFYSILTNLSKDTRYKYELYASFKSKNERFLIQDIPNSVAKQRCFYTANNTRITKERINKILANQKDAAILVCGTESYNEMVRSCCGNERNCYFW